MVKSPDGLKFDPIIRARKQPFMRYVEILAKALLSEDGFFFC
jgi:hypothetical protein